MKDTGIFKIEEFSKAQNYWRNVLTVKISEINVFLDKKISTDCEMKTNTLTLDGDISSKIINICNSNDLSLYIYALTCFKINLYKLSNQTDLIVTSPTLSKQLSNDFVIFRDVIDPGYSFKEFLLKIRLCAIEGYKKEYFNIENLFNELQIFNSSIIFDYILAYKNIHSDERINNVLKKNNNGLFVVIIKNGKEISIETTYNTKIYEENAICRFINSFLLIITQVCNNSLVKINDIKLITEKEEKTILKQLNCSNKTTQNKTLIELFNETVITNPNKIVINSVYEFDASKDFSSEKLFDTNYLGNYCFTVSDKIVVRDLDYKEIKLYLIKTHDHKCFIVNYNVLEILKLFKEQNNIESVYNEIKNYDLNFSIFVIDFDDILEIGLEYKKMISYTPKESGKINFLDFVKELYTYSLLQINQRKFENNRISKNQKGNFENEIRKIEVNDIVQILKGEKELNRSKVLLLGDTPGMGTSGLMYLSSYLKRNNISNICQFYDFSRNIDELKSRIRELIIKIQPEIIALSLKWFLHIYRVLDICRMIKEFSPGIKIVVGGNTASYYSDELIQNQEIDYIIRGEGEKPLLDICEKKKEIANVVYRKDNKIIKNEITYKEDENNSSEIYLSNLNELLVSKNISLFGTFFIYTHKGCDKNCIYCGGCRESQNIVFNRKKVFSRGIKEVRKDIREAFGFSTTLMFDFHKKNSDLINYCDSIWKDIDLTNHFCILTNVYLPSFEIIKLASQKFKYVYWNIDIASLSERHRKELQKKNEVKHQPSDKELFSFLAECQKYDNCEVRINLIAGLPRFTLADFEYSNNAITFILENYSVFSELHWARLHAQPGASIINNTEKYNMFSLASNFDDFFIISKKNYINNFNYPTLESFEYPYIYYNNDKLNSLTTESYININNRILDFKRKKLNKIIGEEITYFDLNKRVDKIATTLEKSNVNRNTIVALIVDDSIQMLVGILGIMKAGGAYLPIEKNIPQARLQYILNDSNAKIILTDSESSDLNQLASDIELNIIHFDQIGCYENIKKNIALINKPSDIAYITYTSGSTGKPKGVLVKHEGIANYALWRKDYYNYKNSDIALQLLSYSFDGFGSNFYTSIISGGQLVIVPSKRKLDYDFIRNVVKECKVTNISFVPSMYKALLEKVESNELSSLRFIVLAGERASIDIINQSKTKAKHVILYNEYGPTENSVTTSTKKGLDENCILNIGAPIFNNIIHILNENKDHIPTNLFGEIYIEGIGIARGYLNDIEQTNEKFVKFNPTDEKILYRTGDIGKRKENGEIELYGRQDSQLKIRGYRIDLDEINKAILAINIIDDSVVLDIKDNNNEVQLTAFVISKSDFDSLELIEQLSEVLPVYMVPVSIIRIKSFPINANGKLDKDSLKDIKEKNSKKSLIKPRDNKERNIADIWSKLLAIEKDTIGINSSFFELGGHSLKATELAAKLRKQYGLDVSLLSFFKNPTIEYLSKQIKDKPDFKVLKIPKAEKKDFYELSSAQKRLFFLNEINPFSTVYNTPQLIPLKNADIERLNATFNALIERHESLRTSFKMLNDIPVQTIHSNIKLFIQEYEYEDDNINKEFYKLVQPFELSEAPLLRVSILKNNKLGSNLFIDMHHIVTDGISINVLIEEFEKLYSGKNLEKLQLQYKDYSVWQNSSEYKEEIKNKEQYWINKFQDGIPRIDIPTDFPRPKFQKFEGHSISFKIDEIQTRKLKAIASQENMTLYMLMVSIFNIFLMKISGQEDIIIGTPIAGRKHDDIMKIIGLFVNTLALRIKPSGKKSIIGYFKEVRDILLNDFENQEYQFEDLVNKLNIEKDLSHSPIFDVMIAFQNQSENIEDHLISDENLVAAPVASKFDLTLNGCEVSSEIQLSFEYNIALFKDTTIISFIKYFKNIVKSICISVDKNIGDIQIVSQQEKENLLNNSYEVKDLLFNSIPHLFDNQCRMFPDKVAVVFKDTFITYKELLFRSRKVANYILHKRIAKNSIIALMLDKNIEAIIGLIGILKSGCAYLPISEDMPVSRTKYILNDSKTSCIITDSVFYDNANLLSFNGEIINISDKEIFSNCDVNHMASRILEKDDLAYIMYTSGTTGKPKGALIEHGSIINLVSNPNFIKYVNTDRLMLTGALSFDISTFEIWGSILNGVELHIVNENTLLDLKLLTSLIIKSKISIIHFIPQLFYIYAEQAPKLFSKLNYLLVGGDKVNPDMVNKIRSEFKDLKILHMYGPTENTTFTLFNTVTKDYTKNIPIGKPINNTKIYILDKHNNLVPTGVNGELCISGKGLSRGYLNRIELTADSFINNPFSVNEKLYKTGDCARWLEGCDIEFLGRIDEQVKINGKRIELLEIQAVLGKCKGIKDCVVVSHENNNEKHLIGYFISDSKIDTSKIKNYLSENLPDYMIPLHLVQLDKIPLNINGKIDKTALPVPELKADLTANEPENEVEIELLSLLSNILNCNVKDINVGSNFFEIGGHSINALNFTSKINKQFNTSISIRDIFTLQTIKKISLHILNANNNELTKIKKIEKREYYDLSFSQRRIWFQSMTKEVSLSYNMPFAFIIDDELDIEKIKNAFTILFEKHEVLRTVFLIVNDIPVQHVLSDDKVGFNLEVCDLVNVDNNELLAQDIAKKETEIQFDLEKGPLLNAKVVLLEERKYLLLVTMHHIIGDFISVNIIFQDIFKFYNLIQNESKYNYKSTTFSFIDYAKWQNSLIINNSSHKEFWLKHFEGKLSVTELPIDKKRPEILTHNGSAIEFELDNSISNQLKVISKSNNATSFMTMYTLFSILLHKLSGQKDIVLGFPISGREIDEINNQVGLFLNTLAVRTRIDEKMYFTDLLKINKKNILSAYEHQIYPFDLLLHDLNIKRDLSRNPIFDVMIDMITNDNQRTDFKNKNFEIQKYKAQYKNRNKFDITFFINEDDSSFKLNVEYNSDLFYKDTIDLIIEYFQSIVKQVVENVYIDINSIKITRIVELPELTIIERN